MTGINPAAVAAREAARSANGEFGEQLHSAPPLLSTRRSTTSTTRCRSGLQGSSPTKLIQPSHAGSIGHTIAATIWNRSRRFAVPLALSVTKTSSASTSATPNTRAAKTATQRSTGGAGSTRRRQPIVAAVARSRTITFRTLAPHPKVTWADLRSRGISRDTPRRRGCHRTRSQSVSVATKTFLAHVNGEESSGVAA